MGKRTRGKEVKGKSTKDAVKSKIYIFCEGNTEEIYLTHFQNRTYNVEIVPIDTEHTDAVGIVRFAMHFGNAPYGKTAEQMKHHVKKLFREEMGIADYCETTEDNRISVAK